MFTQVSRRRLLMGGGCTVAQQNAGPHTRLARIGDCCVEAQGITCRRCVEICDPRAILLPPIDRRRQAPSIQPASCSGCGDCVPVCPTGAIALLPATSLSAVVSPAQSGEVP